MLTGSNEFLECIKREAELCADNPLSMDCSKLCRFGCMDYSVHAALHMVRLSETKRQQLNLRHAKSHADVAVALAPLWVDARILRAKVGTGGGGGGSIRAAAAGAAAAGRGGWGWW